MREGSAQEWFQPGEGHYQSIDCGGGCDDLALFLTRGWGLPPEDWASPFGERMRLRVKRIQYIENRQRGSRVRQRILVDDGDGERLLRYFDSRETWRETLEGSGVKQKDVDAYFPERAKLGRPRLHRFLTPSWLAGLVTRIGDAISHLESLPTPQLADHFTEAYGELWPPHLEAVHEMLCDKWSRNGSDLSTDRRAYERKGTALRVATVLPLRARGHYDPASGNLERVAYTPCPFTDAQLRPIFDRA